MTTIAFCDFYRHYIKVLVKSQFVLSNPSEIWAYVQAFCVLDEPLIRNSLTGPEMKGAKIANIRSSIRLFHLNLFGAHLSGSDFQARLSALSLGALSAPSAHSFKTLSLK